MDNRKSLKVYMGKNQIGTLALYDSWRVAFEYTDDWILRDYYPDNTITAICD